MRAVTIILSGLSALVAAQSTTAASDISDTVQSGVSSVLSSVSAAASNDAGTPAVSIRNAPLQRGDLKRSRTFPIG